MPRKEELYTAKIAKKQAIYEAKASYRQAKAQYKLERRQYKLAKKEYAARRRAGESPQAPVAPVRPMYTLGEELFNSISHGVGALLSIAALVILAVTTARTSDPLFIFSGCVYGITLILLYVMSTLYHALSHPGAKAVFRVFDHCSIFLLIAGTYTPYALISLGGVLGWVIFGGIWAAAILGVTLKAISLKRFRIFSAICYVVMGWAIVVVIRPLLAGLDPQGVLLLFLGGICYTVGIVFFALKKVRYMHSVWHIFVMAGSILHFFSILLHVFPR